MLGIASAWKSASSLGLDGAKMVKWRYGDTDGTFMWLLIRSGQKELCTETNRRCRAIELLSNVLDPMEVVEWVTPVEDFPSSGLLTGDLDFRLNEFVILVVAT
jgi:hypothetical protein